MKNLVIFDFNRTIYDPKNKKIIDGVYEVLKELQLQNIDLVLISKKEGDRMKIVKDNGLEKYFREILFVQNKSPELFSHIIEKYHAEKVYVIGDYIPAEIRCGNIVGAETIWYCDGRFRSYVPQNIDEKPDHIINKIVDCISIIT